MHHTTSYRRAFLAALSALALTFGSIGLGALPASAADLEDAAVSSISGTVVDAASGSPVVGASVVVLDASGAEAGSAYTGDTGGYTASGLAAGSYRVSISHAPSHSPIFWPAASDPAAAESIALTVGEARTGVDVALQSAVIPSADPEVTDAPESEQSSAVETAPAEEPSLETFAITEEIAEAASTPFTVSGRVTDTAGDPIEGAQVSISGPTWSTASTLADGTYSLSVESGGTFSLSAWKPGYLSDSTALFNLSADATDMNLVLIRAAKVSGSASTADGTPVRGWVRLVDPATGVTSAVGSAGTTGEYTIDGAPAGTYVVFFDPDDSSLAPQYFEGAETVAAATKIVITEGSSTSGIDFTLNVGRSITGTVSPAPVDGQAFWVTATPVNGGPFSAFAEVQPDGSYSLTGLLADSYVVGVRGSAASGNVLQGYYQGAADASDATPVSVSDSSKDHIDITLFEGARIEGTVSASDEPAPFQNTQITAYRWDGGSWETEASISGWGSYVIGSVSGWGNYLDPGTYTVGFSDPGAPYGVDPSEWDYPYCDQFFDLAPTLETADTFDLSAGGVASGIDGLLETTCDLPDVNPGAVSITGTPRVGETLSAQPGTWAPAPVELAYQWFADGDPIAGATSDTLVVDPGLLGSSVEVKVTGSRPGYDSATAASDAVTVTAGVLEPATPSITGDAVVGSALQAVVAPWGPAPVALSYVWKANGAAIPGATGSEFVPGTDEVGDTITVTVTGVKDGYATSSRTSIGVGPITSVPLENLSPGTPSISGDPRVGQVLTAAPGTWGPAPVTLSYQWYADDEIIDGATGETYLVQAGDLGTQITVSVRGTKPGYNPATAFADATAIVAAGSIDVGTPTVTGQVQVGKTLTADPGTWGPDGVQFTYQWLSNGEPLSGATGPTLVLNADLLGADVAVRVTGSKPGYTTRAATSAEVGPVAEGSLDVGTPTITGAPEVGSPLTAATGVWGPQPVEFTYQWLVGGEAVEGATESTYVPRSTDVGKTITVAVTGTKPGYETQTVTSEETGAVTAKIAVSDASLETGQTLTVTGEGFGPGEDVLLELHSEPVNLGTAQADEAGAFSIDVTIPASTPAGAHHIVAIGQETDRTASVGITVVGPQPVVPAGGGTVAGLPDTGLVLPIGTITLAALLIIAGIAFSSVRGRRSETSGR